MNVEQILALPTTKTEKIKLLLATGMTRKEVAELLGVGYGFVQNIYAKIYGVSRTNNRSQMPFRFDRSFGVEIEAKGPSIDEVCRAINAAGVLCQRECYNHTTRPHWKVVTDGSVCGGFEVVSPVLRGKNGLEQLKKVCEALRQIGSRPDRQCGLHVHLGTGDFGEDPQIWKALYRNYATLEETIDSFMPASRRGSANQYCQSMRVRDLEQKLERATTLREIERSVTGTSRYFKLNSQSFWRHKTVEFRQHSGTIDYDKIANWIEFCARFVEYARRCVTARDMEGATPPTARCAAPRTEALVGVEGLKKFLSRKGLEFYDNRRLQLAA